MAKKKDAKKLKKPATQKPLAVVSGVRKGARKGTRGLALAAVYPTLKAKPPTKTAPKPTTTQTQSQAVHIHLAKGTSGLAKPAVKRATPIAKPPVSQPVHNIVVNPVINTPAYPVFDYARIESKINEATLPVRKVQISEAAPIPSQPAEAEVINPQVARIKKKINENKFAYPSYYYAPQREPLPPTTEAYISSAESVPVRRGRPPVAKTEEELAMQLERKRARDRARYARKKAEQESNVKMPEEEEED